MPRTIEDDLLGDLYADLKGSKKKPDNWMTIAEKCEQAVKLHQGSITRTADKLSVHPWLLRSILSLKKLDTRVQDMVRRGEILFDSAQRLNGIKPVQRQYEVAKLLLNVSNKKQREIIQQAKEHPDSDLVDYRSRVLGEKQTKEKIRVLIVPVREEMYRALERASNEEKRPAEKIISELIGNWLEKRPNRN